MEELERQEYLTSKLKEVGASGNKLHVIFRRGHWAVLSEGSAKALGVYRFKNSAIRKARSVYAKGLTDAVIVHNKNGSVLRASSTGILHAHAK